MPMKYLPSPFDTSDKNHIKTFPAVVAACCLGFALQANAETAAQKIEAAYYPYGGAEELAVKAVKSASQSIFVAAEDITSGPLTQSLVEAHKRGVNILVVLDKSQDKQHQRGAKSLTKEGIQVHIDRKHTVMHNYYMVIDGQTVETGRFNYSQEAAKKSADNVLVMWNSPDIAKSYRANWQEHWDHSDPYK